MRSVGVIYGVLGFLVLCEINAQQNGYEFHYTQREYYIHYPQYSQAQANAYPGYSTPQGVNSNANNEVSNFKQPNYDQQQQQQQQNPHVQQEYEQKKTSFPSRIRRLVDDNGKSLESKPDEQKDLPTGEKSSANLVKETAGQTEGGKSSADLLVEQLTTPTTESPKKSLDDVIGNESTEIIFTLLDIPEPTEDDDSDEDYDFTEFPDEDYDFTESPDEDYDLTEIPDTDSDTD